jgi:tRNA-specific 2-thiouridylase
VVKLDPNQKHVIVGPREALVTRRLKLRDVNWLGPQTIAEFPVEGLEIYAKVRSTRPPKEALLFALPNGEFEVELLDGEEGVAPGQACVFYEGLAKEAQLWGGGWIDRTVTEVAIPEIVGAA